MYTRVGYVFATRLQNIVFLINILCSNIDRM